MQLPIVAPAPLVAAHAPAFRDLFENRRQYQHFEQYLTALMVLPNTSLTNIARCVLDRADKTNLSRFLSEAPWSDAAVNDRRMADLLQQTTPHRVPKANAALVIDATLCEHVGSLFEYVDRHYNHGDGTYPLAHNPVTSFYVSGPVRFPLDLRLYRRYDELTCWETFVTKHCPEPVIPTQQKERTRLHKIVDPVLLADPDFADLHRQFRTKIALATELIEAAIRHRVPCGVLLFDSWYLSADLVTVATRRQKDWVSLLKKTRNVETASFVLRDADGQPLPLPGPHVSVEALVAQIPASAYRAVAIDATTTDWCFTLAVRLPGLGQVRLVISYDNAELKGTYAVLVTNRVDWTAHRIIATYRQRWPTETFYQDSTGHLGLDAYRMRSADAIGKHWCLVFVAYSFLHLACLGRSLKEESSPVKTIGEACRQQAAALIQQLLLYTHDRLLRGVSIDALFAHLFAKQRLLPT